MSQGKIIIVIILIAIVAVLGFSLWKQKESESINKNYQYKNEEIQKGDENTQKENAPSKDNTTTDTSKTNIKESDIDSLEQSAKELKTLLQNQDASLKTDLDDSNVGIE